MLLGVSLANVKNLVPRVSGELFVSFIFLLHVFFSFFRIISLKKCNFVPITKQYKENETYDNDGCSRLNDYG